MTVDAACLLRCEQVFPRGLRGVSARYRQRALARQVNPLKELWVPVKKCAHLLVSCGLANGGGDVNRAIVAGFQKPAYRFLGDANGLHVKGLLPAQLPAGNFRSPAHATWLRATDPTLAP